MELFSANTTLSSYIYSVNGEFYRVRFIGGLSYNSLTRDRDTITLKGAKLLGPLKLVFSDKDPDGKYFTQDRILTADYVIKTPSEEVSRTSYSVDLRTYDPTRSEIVISAADVSLGDVSFKVAPLDTKETLIYGVPYEDSLGVKDENYSHTEVSFPIGKRTVTFSIEHGTFDLEIGGKTYTKQTTFTQQVDAGTTYTISNVVADAGYYIKETTPYLSGTITDDLELVVAETLKYKKFKVSGENVIFDLEFDGVKYTDLETWTKNDAKIGQSYKVTRVVPKEGYILDERNQPQGVIGDKDLDLKVGMATKIDLSSLIIKKTPIEVKIKGKVTNTSTRTRNWIWTATLKTGDRKLETISKEVGEEKEAELIFNRVLKVETPYNIVYTLIDDNDEFHQTFTIEDSFELPLLAEIILPGKNQKVSYFTITDEIEEGGKVNYSFKRITLI